MVDLNFIPIDYDYFDFNGTPFAKIIGRSDTGKRICLIDTIVPYFWAILKPGVKDKKIKAIQKRIQDIQIHSEKRITKVLKTELHEKKFLEKPVKAIKIFITNLKDIHDVRAEIDYPEIDKTREYDLNFITKYIIERKVKPLFWYKVNATMLDNQEFGGIAQSLNVDMVLKVETIDTLEKYPKFVPKVLAFDIEASDLDPGKGETWMISLYGKNYEKVFTFKGKSKKHKYVQNYEDEEEMLEAFIKAVDDYDPDILTGYFSDGFDLPFLRERAKRNKIKLALGIDGSQPTFSRGAQRTGKIKGRVHIDLLRFIRNAYSQYLQTETLSLNEVSNELLGEKKVNFDAFAATKAKTIDWEKFYEYNLQDSILTYKLFMKAWPDISEITKIIQEPLFNSSRTTMASAFENLVIHSADKFNEIIEKRPHEREIAERRSQPRYVGAFVFQPVPGLYENIAFFDFSSMYGSVIVSYNLSRGTHQDRKHKSSFIGEYKEKPTYFSKEKGMIPQLMEIIIDKRRLAKAEYNKDPNPISKARSNAFKLIANAAYGYQGFFGARYYCIEAASSTAYFARENIKKAIDTFEKNGFKVVYSDTDSIATVLGKKSEKDALNLLDKINKKLPGIMALDYEGLFTRGIWVTKRTGDFGAKKKYALIDKKGKIKIRGFETVRRDWCRLARDTQNKILNLILTTGDDKQALEYLKTIIKKLKDRKIPIKDLIIKTQLKKPISEYKSQGPHVTIAKRMKEKGLPTDIGMLIEYYIAEPENFKNKKRALVRDKARLPDEPGKYDLDYYLNNQIIPSIENIMAVFKINTKELADGKKQKNLFDF
ncbi:hypothetical protein GOV14_04115 [Candidatus Pacearchaeota archaeon]|nr:hypothetical protein [Candidatus Pacearchaeota archaeon]